MSNATLIESFLDMMSAERGASVNTIAAYRRDLLDFAAHQQLGDLSQAHGEPQQPGMLCPRSARAREAGSTVSRRM